jgi:hypothetical protein
MKCVCCFSLQFLSEIFLTPTRIETDIIINVRRSLCIVPVCSCRILMEFELPRQIFEKSSYIKFHENPLVGAETFRADRQTDTDRHGKTNSRFPNFANAPKNGHQPL